MGLFFEYSWVVNLRAVNSETALSFWDMYVGWIMKNSINFESKFKKFSNLWEPKIIAEMNNYQFKLVKIKGEFISHQHTESDEVFIVLEGKMNIQFEHETVEVNAGEMIVVPKGELHKPFSEEECKIMLVEPIGIINTGDAGGDLTAPNDKWI